MGGEITILPPAGEEHERTIEHLRRQVRQLERERDDATRRAERAGEDAARAMSMLRQQLSPLYRALQAVFGELDAAGIADAPVSTPTAGHAPSGDSRVAAVWDSWKQKMPGKPAAFIDALLLHGEMTGEQLRIATRTAAGSVHGIVYKLNKAGLLNKNGGKFSLKQL